MRKIITLLAIVALTVFSSCEGPMGPPGYNGQDGLIAEVFELKNINFDYNTIDGYTIYQKLTPNILGSDQILIYRLTGTINSTTPIWQLIPRTIFLTQGELDYDFDFSKEGFTIYAGGTYDLVLTPQYVNNQTFRIVIVPGYFSSTIDKSNYEAVVKALNLSESKVKTIELQ